MRCLVVVSHPDDESIWMGGTILRHSDWQWHVLSLCRAGDADREPRFHLAVQALGATGYIRDLDDSSPVLAQLSDDLVEIKQLVLGLPLRDYDLVLTHGPAGEYTYHPRHSQANQAVNDMIADGELHGTLITTAYYDCGGACIPKPAEDADIRIDLTSEEFMRKQHILRDIYNFGPGSFEFEATGPVEAFKVPDTIKLAGVKSVLEDNFCVS